MIMATGNHVYTYLSTHNNVPKYAQYVLPTIFACMLLMFLHMHMVWIPTYSCALLAIHVLCGYFFGGRS